MRGIGTGGRANAEGYGRCQRHMRGSGQSKNGGGRRESYRLVAVLTVQALLVVAGLAVVLMPLQSRLKWLTSERIESENLAESYRLANAMQQVSQELDPSEPVWRDAVSMILATGSFGAKARVVVLGDDGRVVATTGGATHADAALFDSRVRVAGADLRVRDANVGKALLGTDENDNWMFVQAMPNGAVVVVEQEQSQVALQSQASSRMMLGWAAGSLTVALSLGAMLVYAVIRRQHVVLEHRNDDLAVTLEKRLTQSLAARTALILGLAKLADYRDTDTGSHLERICAYSDLLAKELKATHAEINDTWITHLKPAASLHDIGKVGVPDPVLLKPGKLTPAERKLVERHTYMGADTLIAIRAELGDDELINLAIQIALFHHERWDGSGYPLGLRGEQIPLSARIVSLADVYDALTSRRVYKKAMAHEKACELICDLRATHFDPEVVDAFLRAKDDFDRVRNKMQSFGDLMEAAHTKAAA